MDLFFDNLNLLFKGNQFIFLKNSVKFNSIKYKFIYEVEYNNNKYTVLSCKNSSLKPIISVCIPTYNGNNSYVLLKALEEWKNNKGINIDLVEFVIVENGSETYNSEILKNFNLNIKFINLKEKNLGKARRISVEKASSDLLLLVNDDTIPTEFLIRDHIKYQIENYNNNLAILGSFKFHKDVLDNNFMKIINDNDRQLFFQNFLKNNTVTNIFVSNNISIRKEYVLKAGNFCDDFTVSGEDNDLEKRLTKNNLRSLFKSELVSYHYHKHNIKSYIELLKIRYFFDIKISLKYELSPYLEKNLFSLDKDNILSSYFFLNYITKNYEKDNYFKYYISLIHYICFFVSYFDSNYYYYYIKDIQDNKKKVLVIVDNPNYSLYQTYKNFEIKYINQNTKLHELIDNNYDYFLFVNSKYQLLPFSIELLVFLFEIIDKSYKIILSYTFKIDNETGKFSALDNVDFFIKKECLLNPIFLEEDINIDLLIKIKNLYRSKNIDVPFTSIYLD
jgi:hypothetical protein